MARYRTHSVRDCGSTRGFDDIASQLSSGSGFFARTGEGDAFFFPVPVPEGANALGAGSLGNLAASRYRTKISFSNFLLCLAIVLMGMWLLERHYSFFSSPSRTGEDSLGFSRQRVSWYSAVPSRMASVARLALAPGDGADKKLAQDIIISSALDGTALPSSCDGSFIATAFNPLWEVQLSAKDRELALALGLMPLLGSRASSAVGSISEDEIHPGLLFALLAHLDSPAAAAGLSGVSVSSLASLPGAYGKSFAGLLEASGEELSLASPSLRELASLMVEGISPSNYHLLVSFLSSDFEVHMGALAVFFSSDMAVAEQLFGFILDAPNNPIQDPILDWAKKWRLRDWGELDSVQRLRILAGVVPNADLSVDRLAKLFAHPSAKLRSYAISRAIHRVPFANRASYELFSLLADNPQLLSAEQTLQVASLMEKREPSPKAIDSWLAMQPAPLAVSSILLAGSGKFSSAEFNARLMYYLDARKWRPSAKELKKLCFHTETSARFFAYIRLFEQFSKTSSGRNFFVALKSKETNPRLKRELGKFIPLLS